MSATRVLIITADDQLLDDLLRLVAAAGCVADVARDVGQVPARWRSAVLVLLGSDRLLGACQSRLPRRDGVLLVGTTPPKPEDLSLIVSVGAQHVLTLPAAEAELIDLLSDTAASPGAPGLLLALVGGRGGAGASVLATALAVTAARTGEAVLLVDADPLGGGLDLLLGAEQEPGLRWPDLAQRGGRPSAESLLRALPSSAGVSVLAHDRRQLCDPDPHLLAELAATGVRAGFAVIVDLPRELGPGAQALAASADRVLAVVPADVRSCAAALTVTRTLRPISGSLGVVARLSRGASVTPDLVAASLDLPLDATLRTEPGLVSALARGRAPAAHGRGPLAAVSRNLLAASRGQSQGSAA